MTTVPGTLRRRAVRRGAVRRLSLVQLRPRAGPPRPPGRGRAGGLGDRAGRRRRGGRAARSPVLRGDALPAAGRQLGERDAASAGRRARRPRPARRAGRRPSRARIGPQHLRLAGRSSRGDARRPPTRTGPAPTETTSSTRVARSRLATAARRRRARCISALLGGAFLVVAIALAAHGPTATLPSLVRRRACSCSPSRRLRTSSSRSAPASAIPTQLVFVPMLFLLPLGWVPLAVAAGSWISLNADVVRGRRHRERVLVLLCSCWYVFGPVLVLLAFADGAPRWSHWPVYVAALAAQFGADLASTAAARVARAWHLAAAPARPPAAIAYGVDAALAPLGLLAASPRSRMSYAFLLAPPGRRSSSPSSPASAAAASARRSSCGGRYAAPRAARRHHRGRRRLHRHPQPGVVDARARRRRRAAS